jgi:hypothetical protein
MSDDAEVPVWLTICVVGAVLLGGGYVYKDWQRAAADKIAIELKQAETVKLAAQQAARDRLLADLKSPAAHYAAEAKQPDILPPLYGLPLDAPENAGAASPATGPRNTTTASSIPNAALVTPPAMPPAAPAAAQPSLAPPISAPIYRALPPQQLEMSLVPLFRPRPTGPTIPGRMNHYGTWVPSRQLD